MNIDPEHNDLNHRNAQRDTEQEEVLLNESQSDESYYALLNLPKDATVEEIQKRYKALAGRI
jgi:hypothetical protein